MKNITINCLLGAFLLVILTACYFTTIQIKCERNAMENFISCVQSSNSNWKLVQENFRIINTGYKIIRLDEYPIPGVETIKWSDINIEYSNYDLWEVSSENGPIKLLVPHSPNAILAYYMREYNKKTHK